MQEQLKRIFLFEHLSDGDIKSLSAISQIKEYQAGEILFYEGDPSEKLFILTKGIVKAYKIDMKGNEIVLHYFHPVSMVAEMANLHRIPFPATAEFETEGSVVEINYPLFEEGFLKNPAVSFEVIKSLSQKIKLLENVITTHLTLDSTSRVAKHLYDNENLYRTMKHNKIATILNITPETHSRTLRKFKTLGLISDEGKDFQVINKAGLFELFS
ncbi:MAG: Crp/Fnr family transcriptional regulator [Sulfuricurvum sp.]|nr:Crp/Fnr family transcriptional regulator [Sulfuricurvum sp.]